jgi:putative acetyltransferase
MNYKIAEMNLDRYNEIIEFWQKTPELWVSDDDSYEASKIYFKRNPHSNFLALYDGKIIGTCKCCHDGRRGYIHHVAVASEFRKKGIAKEMVDRCFEAVKKEGIRKFRLAVMNNNTEGLKFWKHIGFEEQVYDYRTLEKDI